MTKEIIIRAITALRKQEVKATRLKGNGIDIAELVEESIGSLEELVCHQFTGNIENLESVTEFLYNSELSPELVYEYFRVTPSSQTEPFQSADKQLTDLRRKEHITGSINNIVSFCHNQSKAAGWHDKPREVGTDLMLIVSEIAEAMEGDRKGLMDDHLPHRKMFEVELADAVIRIFDTAGKYGLDLGGAVREKLEYNKYRADHKRENRAADGGKKY